MSKETANNLLKIHGDFYNKKSFLYYVKDEKKVDKKLFCEIMESLITLNGETLKEEQIKNIYSIIFWCRSWMESGWLEKEMGSVDKKTLQIYVQIIENALYYLLHKDIEEAFWMYNEFLDGRYQ